MTPFAVSLFVFIPLSLTAANYLAAPADRRFLATLVGFAWLVLGTLTAFANQWAHFSGGGDDEGYFWLASQPHRSLADLLDFSRFQSVLEQPGYPWLLSLLNLVVEPDLLTYKLVNLLVLILIALVWYRIGLILGDSTFGRTIAAGTLALTPLWFYVFFLRKDLVIVLLQSLFLLGLVQQWRQNRLDAWFLVGAATLLLLPFRTQLVLQNVAVAIGSIVLALAGNSRSQYRRWSLILGIPVMVGLLAAAANPAILQSFGVFTEHRVVGSEAMWLALSQSGEASTLKRYLFPVLYVLTETSALNPEAWTELDPFWLRGALALPWIILAAPMFLLGVQWLVRSQPDLPRYGGFLGAFRSSRLVATPWGVIIFFILSSAALSWAAGDTTRWRLPDMPAMLAVAIAARYYRIPGASAATIVLWCLSLVLLISVYALTRA